MLRKRNVDILVKGSYGAKNFGDDALQYFLIEWFKKNKFKVAFITKHAGYLKKIFPDVKLYSQEKAFNINSKVLILGGGTQFFAFKKITLKEKLAFYIKNLSLNKLLFTFQKRVLKKEINSQRIIGLGLGLGPFQENTKELEAASQDIKHLDEVFTRDRLSFEFSKVLNEKTFQFTDICFLPEIIDFSKFQRKRGKINKIGIIVRDWNFSEKGNQYYTKLQSESNYIKELGYLTTFILFKPEAYWEEFLKSKNEKYIAWNPDTMQIHDFLNELSKFDLMISARFHGIIFAALLGIPSISIGIEQKLEIVAEFFPKSLKVWPYPFTKSLVDKIQQLDKNYSEIQQNLQQETLRNHELANSMFIKLNQLLLEILDK